MDCRFCCCWRRCCMLHYSAVRSHHSGIRWALRAAAAAAARAGDDGPRRRHRAERRRSVAIDRPPVRLHLRNARLGRPSNRCRGDRCRGDAAMPAEARPTSGRRGRWRGSRARMDAIVSVGRRTVDIAVVVCVVVVANYLCERIASTKRRLCTPSSHAPALQLQLLSCPWIREKCANYLEYFLLISW